LVVSVSPERLPVLAGQSPRHWLALAVFAALIIALVAYQWESLLAGRKQELALSALTFSHGLAIGQECESGDWLISYLGERGFRYEREVEEGHFELRDASETVLLRVKEHESRISAVYLFALEGFDAEAFRRDLLGLTKKEMHVLLGKPGRKEVLSGEGHGRERSGEASRTVEAWFYLARDFDLTVGFDRNGRTVEAVLQAPITR